MTRNLARDKSAGASREGRAPARARAISSHSDYGMLAMMMAVMMTRILAMMAMVMMAGTLRRQRAKHGCALKDG